MCQTIFNLNSWKMPLWRAIFPESPSLCSRTCDGDVVGPEMMQAAKQGLRDVSHYVAMATHVVECNCHPLRTAAAGMTCAVDLSRSVFTLSDANGLVCLRQSPCLRNNMHRENGRVLTGYSCNSPCCQCRVVIIFRGTCTSVKLALGHLI